MPLAVFMHDELNNEFWLTWFFSSVRRAIFSHWSHNTAKWGLLNSTKHCYCIYTQRDLPHSHDFTHSHDYNFCASFVSMFHHVHISHIVSALIDIPSSGYTHIFIIYIDTTSLYTQFPLPYMGICLSPDYSLMLRWCTRLLYWEHSLSESYLKYMKLYCQLLMLCTATSYHNAW